MRKIILALAAALSATACTPNPALNMTEGGLGGAMAGCAIGAAVTAPLLGIGCVPGALIGGSSGAAVGAATTPPPAWSTYPQPYPW
jgi:hypothetical protein